jgi:hypothetical protein
MGRERHFINHLSLTHTAAEETLSLKLKLSFNTGKKDSNRDSIAAVTTVNYPPGWHDGYRNDKAVSTSAGSSTNYNIN